AGLCLLLRGCPVTRRAAGRPRSAFDHVHAGRRRELERVRREGGIALPFAEADHALLAERVGELHPLQPVRAEAQARRAEAGTVGLARLDHQPVEAALAAGLLDDVVAVQAARVDQRRQRAALLGVALGAPGG